MMRPISQLPVVVVALLLVVHGCAEPPAPRGTLIENVTIVDALQGTRPAQRVLVVDDRIELVAPVTEPAPAALETLDGTGLVMIPGLWDMHVHFLYDMALTDGMAEAFLRYGVTSVRDTGGDLATLTALRRRLELERAPRIFLSGPLLDGRFTVYDGGDPGRPRLGTPVPDTALARERVRELAAAGADFIKIYELVTPDVFAELVREARSLGLPVAAHVPLLMTADQAGPSADSMEHLRNIELACAADWADLLAVRTARIEAFTEGRGYDLRRELHALQRLPAIAAYDESRCNTVLDALRSTTQVPTLRLNTVRMVQPFERADWPEALAELPADVQARWQAGAAAMRDAAALTEPSFEAWSLFLTGRAHARNVPIGAGTDTPIGLGIPGYSLHTELELLVRSGLTPREALAAATTVPARFFGLDDEMGSIVAGQAADLVLLEASPLEDIANTRRIHRVMARGRWVD